MYFVFINELIFVQYTSFFITMDENKFYNKLTYHFQFIFRLDGEEQIDNFLLKDTV